MIKALSDGLLGQGGNPQTIDGAFDLGQLHDPTLDKLTLLSGIAAIYNAVRLGEKAGNDSKLLLYAIIRLEFYAKSLWHYGQELKIPPFEHWVIVLWFL